MVDRRITEMLTTMEHHSELEAYTKADLIYKYVTINRLIRKIGHQHVTKHLYEHEPQWFKQLYFDAMYEINTSDASTSLVVCQELAQRYIADMEAKMRIVIEGCVRYCDDRKSIVHNENAQNLFKPYFTSYTLDELRDKMAFYQTLMLKEGAFAADDFILKEPNGFIRRTIWYVVDGYDTDEIIYLATLDMKCKLAQYRELWEITELGLIGVLTQEYTTKLETKLLCYLEEAYRENVRQY